MTEKIQILVVGGVRPSTALLITALEKMQAAARAAVAEIVLVADEPREAPKLKLPEIKEYPPLKPWGGYTGKKKAQWKQETFGRKRK